MTDAPDDDLAWETTASEIAYTCPGFDIVRDDVVLPDGTETDYDYLDDDPAVVVLPFTPDGDVVVIEEWRQAVKRVNRGLPAGSVEPDDADLTAAARRELEEETGYVADSLRSLTTLEPANGITNAVHHVFVAEGCTPTGERDLDFNESIRVEETPHEALRDAVREGDCRDGRTALALLYHDAFRPESEGDHA
ncbi:NUDIX hydrolase [Halarchaeum salinum]|uniref:NUDIX hydrolase n=1 Tax=Halarchaeum salinum TaxID=489912 RepID=A0AAV3S7E3_9EURY